MARPREGSSKRDRLEQHLRTDEPVKAARFCNVHFSLKNILEVVEEANVVKQRRFWVEIDQKVEIAFRGGFPPSNRPKNPGIPGPVSPEGDEKLFAFRAHNLSDAEALPETNWPELGDIPELRFAPGTSLGL